MKNQSMKNFFQKKKKNNEIKNEMDEIKNWGEKLNEEI